MTNFGQTLSIVFKTLPYILLRLLVFSVFGILFVLYLGFVFLTGQALEGLHEAAKPATWIIGFLASFPLVRLAREYTLYLVKAGHIAVIAELATKGSLPSGTSQIQWGKNQVTTYFKQTSVLFLVDQLINGTVKSLNSLLWTLSPVFRMLPGGNGLVKFAQMILYFSLTYIDESILARQFVSTNKPIWQNAKEGVVLYAQIWREILMTALWLGLISVVFFPVVVFLLMTPALGIAQVWPDIKIPAIIGALVFSVVIKAALLDPWTLTHMIVTYLEKTKNLAPNPEWEQKLESVSSKFRQITKNAANAV